MRNFRRWMREYATNWRERHVPAREWGKWGGKRYSWILPEDSWEEGLWPGIRSGSDNPLVDYVRLSGIKKHDQAHNLTSSWTMCANLYFPFGASDYGRDLFASFLRRNVASAVTSLEGVELEYVERGNLSPSELLGEAGGGRGYGQTSPDLGLSVNDGRGLVLVESKFTEDTFDRCSALRTDRSGRMRNPAPERCDHLLSVLDDPAGQCHQTDMGRRYWQILAPEVDRGAVSGLRRCPAAGHGYQLLRQQALAEGIAQAGKYDFVVSAVARDERNDDLLSALGRSAVAELEHWGGFFIGRAHFTVFTHQQWVRWVRDRDEHGRFDDWLDYVCSRYDLGS